MRRGFTLILCLFILWGLVGCDMTMERQNYIYSDDSMIAYAPDSYAAKIYVGGWGDEEFSVAATMAGMETIVEYELETAQEYAFTYFLSLDNGGKVKLVLVTPDDNVVVLAELTGDSEEKNISGTMAVTLEPGINTIRYVSGEAAKFQLKFYEEEIG